MSTNNGGTAIDVKNREEARAAFPDRFQWDPFAEFMSFRPNLRSLFEWPATFPPASAIRGYGFELDLKQKDGKYIAECALPGFKKDDIDVQIRGKNLTITAKAHAKSIEETETYVYRERQRGEFCRTLTFPEPVDAKAVEATYRDGILEVKIPMKQPTTPEKVAIRS